LSFCPSQVDVLLKWLKKMLHNILRHANTAKPLKKNRRHMSSMSYVMSYALQVLHCQLRHSVAWCSKNMYKSVICHFRYPETLSVIFRLFSFSANLPPICPVVCSLNVIHVSTVSGCYLSSMQVIAADGFAVCLSHAECVMR